MAEEIVSNPAETSRPAEVSGESEEARPVDLMEWARQVTNHLGQARQQFAELAAQQNQLLIRAIDEGIDLVRTAPTPDLRQIANEGLEALSEARQAVSSLAQLPPEQLLETAREVARTQATQAVETATDLAGAGAATLLEKGEQILGIIDQKNAQFVEAVKADLHLDEKSAAAALADFSRQLVSNYVEVQRKWMELAREAPFIKSHVEVEPETALAVPASQPDPPVSGSES